MKFAVLVHQAPLVHPASEQALAFVRAALAAGHQVLRVFFLADGVHVANRLSAPPTPETALVRRWSELAEQSGVDLVVCSTAGLKRGVREANLAPGFRISGLGQLAEMVAHADRVLTFGG